MLDNPFGEEISPNIQSEPPLMQLEAIASRPIIRNSGQETHTRLTTASFQAVAKEQPTPPALPCCPFPLLPPLATGREVPLATPRRINLSGRGGMREGWFLARAGS